MILGCFAWIFLGLISPFAGPHMLLIILLAPLYLWAAGSSWTIVYDLGSATLIIMLLMMAAILASFSRWSKWLVFPWYWSPIVGEDCKLIPPIGA